MTSAPSPTTTIIPAFFLVLQQRGRHFYASAFSNLQTENGINMAWHGGGGGVLRARTAARAAPFTHCLHLAARTHTPHGALHGAHARARHFATRTRAFPLPRYTLLCTRLCPTLHLCCRHFTQNHLCCPLGMRHGATLADMNGVATLALLWATNIPTGFHALRLFLFLRRFFASPVPSNAAPSLLVHSAHWACVLPAPPSILNSHVTSYLVVVAWYYVSGIKADMAHSPLSHNIGWDVGLNICCIHGTLLRQGWYLHPSCYKSRVGVLFFWED